MMKKNIYGIAILLILIINISFILAQEIEIKNEIVSFDSEKVDYSISEDGKEIKLEFADGGFAEIKGVRFENILPAGKSINPSYIKIDDKGNILEADLTANEKGSAFLINGLTFEAPPNSRVFYGEDGFHLENIKVSEVDKYKFVEQTISGYNVNLFDELTFSSARVVLNKESYLIGYGKIIYDKMEIDADNNFLIARDSLMDLSDYKGSWIKKTDNGLNIQSVKGSEMEINFLEGNEIFNIPLQEGDKEKFLVMEIYGEEGLEITKKDYLIKGMPPLIKHSSSEQGETIIKNGRHTFKFENGKYLSELGNLNTKNKLSVEFNLESDLLKDKAIYIDDENGYSIYAPKTGENIFTFNKALLAPPEYDFESEIGEKIYSYAEEQIGASAFVSEGRGKCYGTETEKFPGFDCIGLGISSLKNVYPDSSLKDFPPNLQLVETLEKKGWKSFIIEPSSVQGTKTTEEIKNIPPGSIVFLMHSGDEPGLPSRKGISNQEYTNSKGKKISLLLGHTLIKGIGEKNFINAIPNVGYDEMPLRARKINENLEKQGKDPIFIGSVREGEFIPQEDYLLIISPP